MDPFDPLVAQLVVVAYVRTLERDLTEERHPARIDSLPYAKPVIRNAIRTSIRLMTESGQLTAAMQEFFETAYVSLADYIDAELVRLMSEYRRSAAELASDGWTPKDRATSPSWRTVAETSVLAGEVARAITEEAEALRREFYELIASS